MTRGVSSAQMRDISDELQRDRENLFSLADKVLAAAPLRQWGVWVSDAVSSYFLSEFMRDVYTASDKIDGGPPPIVPITNSRSVRADPHHQQAVLARLSQPDLSIAGKNALILCEYTKDRLALSTLSVPLRRLGAASVDAAVLNLDYPGRFITPTSPADKPDIIYDGEPQKHEPAMFRGTLRDAIGQMSVLGEAEPQDDPNCNLELRAYASDAFRALAQEYTTQRQA